MKKKLNDYFYKTKKLIAFGFLFLVVGVFLLFPTKIKASGSYKEITFVLNPEESEVKGFDEGDLILESPTFEYAIFEGWYDNEQYTGDNYYGKEVDVNTPDVLYLKALLKYEEEYIGSFVFEDYLDGYRITSYTGLDSYLALPHYLYTETQTEGLYEIKDVIGIKDGAFIGNDTIYTLNVPKTYTYVSVDLFKELENLVEIYIDEGNTAYSSDYYGALYNVSQTELLYMPANSFVGEYKTPETLQVIKSGSINNLPYLYSVVITSNVLTIEEDAIINNDELERIIIEEGNLVTIGKNAFINNSSLTFINIPSNVLNVEEDILSGSNINLSIYYEGLEENIPITWDSNWNSDGFDIIEDYGSVTFTVTFVDDNDEVIEIKTVGFGKGVTYPEAPEKEDTVEYSFYFAGWDKEVEYVFGDITVKALYYSMTRRYSVTFHDVFGNVIDVIEMAYGYNIDNNYWHNDTKKEEDDEFTYVFERWNPDLSMITGDVDAHPVFTATRKMYTVNFYWNDEGDLFYYEDAYYGDTVDIPSNSPTKDDDETHTYTFSGWYLDIEKTTPYDEAALVVGKRDVYPKYIKELKKFDVIFYNEYQHHETQRVSYGHSAVTPVDPTKESTAEHHYVFIGWDTDFSNITEQIFVYALYDAVKREYEIKFYDYDNTTVLKTETLEYGESATAPDEPSKPSTAEYDYIFSRWSEYFGYISRDLHIYPEYSSSLRRYLVTFYNDDETLLSSNYVYYGHQAYAPYEPYKPPSEQYIYTFDKWDKDFDNITGTLNVYATYTSSLRSYNVYFYNEDGYTLLKEETVEYGSGATAPGIPTKPSTQQYNYTFDKWDKDFDNITGTLNVYATYTSALNNYTYTFYDEDQITILKTESIPYGTLIVAPDDPVKASTQQYVYTFSDWDKTVGNITDNINFYARYTSTLQEYTVVFYDEDQTTILKGPVSVSYGYGVSTPTTPTKESTVQYRYEFDGWDGDYTVITGDINIYATYKSILRSYYVYFYNDTLTSIISYELVNYGSAASAPDDPVKPSTNQYDYVFDGWSDDFSNITGELVVHATFINVLRSYTVNFYEADLQTVFVSEEVEYGSSPENILTPLKASTSEYHYTFSSWDKDYSFITGPLSVYPLYTSAPVLYDVYYNTGGGSIIPSHEQGFNTYINRPTEPTKVGYVFLGWYKEDSFDNEFIFSGELMPASDLTIYAKFIIGEFTINFNSNGGTSVSSITEIYQTPITLTSPTKTGHTFDGWYKDSEFNDEFTLEVMPGENHYLYAKWIINNYTMSFESNGGSTVLAITQNYASIIAVPNNPSKVGHTFIGWYSDIELTNRYYIYSMPANDITLYARWQTNYYTFTFNVGGGTSISPIHLLYNAPIVEPTNPSKVGHTFVGWYSDEQLTTPYTFNLMPAENVTIYAKWTVNNYTISFENLGGTIISDVDAAYDTLLDEPTTPEKVGHTFDGWFKEALLINEWDFSVDKVDNRNMTLYAKWTVNQYTLKFNSNGGSSVDDLVKGYGESITSPTSEKVGYLLTGWFSDEELNNEFIFDVMPASSMTLYAGWVKEEFNIVLNVNGGDVIDDLILYYLDEIELPTPKKAGHTFEGWFSDEELTTSFTLEVMPASNLNAYAKWTINEYTLTFESNGGSIVNPVTKNYNEDITLTSPDKVGHTFGGWYSDEELLVEFTSLTMPAGDMTLYARWVINGYTITFESNGGSYVYSIIEEYNKPINEPDEPAKLGYIFAGWFSNEELNNEFIFDVMPGSNMTLYAKWTQAVYTVKFYNEDETYLGESSGTYGFNATPPADPVKENTQKYSYTFSGWSLSILNIKENINVYATYASTINKYTVTFYAHEEDYSGTNTILLLENINYGSIITAPSIIPTKAQTQQYIYTFDGWSEEFDVITKDIDIYPVFIQTLRKYTVDFYNGEVLHDSQNVEYGSSANTPVVPIRESTTQYDYSFISWSDDYTNITNDLRVYANYSSSLRKYTVSFYNESTLHNVQEVEYGMAANTPEDPVKEPTITTTYTFAGWNTSYNNITNDLTVNATYTESARKYTVNFYNGEVLHDSQEVEYGSSASTPNIPIKDSTEKYDYTFSSWSDDYTNITGNLNITATYTSSLRKYIVNFYNGEVLHNTQEVEYGTGAITPTVPTRDSTAQHDYTFSSWSDDYTNITGDLNITANYTSSIRKYTVNFYNGEILHDTQNVEYGSSAVTPTTPVKASTAEHDYVFDGWSISYTNITKDLNITATYTSVLRKYTVNFYNGQVLHDTQQVEYGKAASLPTDPEKDPTVDKVFIFNSWDVDYDNITGDLDVYAEFDEQIRKYIVNFYNEDKIHNTQNIEYEGSASKPEDPVKQGSNEYSYIFISWDKDYTNIKGDLNIYASYEQVANTYTITFNTNGGSTTGSVSYSFGNSTSAPTNPTKEGYNFNGWFSDQALLSPYTFTTMPARNITLYADWITGQYTISFNSNGGTDVTSIRRYYNDNIIAPTNPSKTGYVFDGWYIDEDLTTAFTFNKMPGYDVTLYAKWNLDEFTIYFNSNGGTAVSPLTKYYLEDINAPIDPTRTGYSFSGWYKDTSLTNIYEFDKMGSTNITLHAKWTVRSFTITFNSSGGSVINPIIENFGMIINEPTNPTKEGYDFDGWYTDDEFNELYKFLLMPASDMTLYAKWEIKEYIISFNSDGGSAVDAIKEPFNTPITAPSDPVKEGYLFTGWYFNDQPYTFTVMGSTNITLKAMWEIKEYTIYFDSNGGSVIDNITLNFKESINIYTNPTKLGHTFTGWYKDGSLYTFTTMPAEDLYVVAGWSINSYTITFNSNGGSDVNKLTLDYDEVLSLATPTKDEHLFVGWYTDSELVNLFTLTKMPNYDVTLHAKWEVITYTITFNSNGGSSVSDLVKAYNEPIVEPTPIKDGYDFDGWYTDEELNNKYTFTTMPKSNLTLYAKWNINTYTITFDSLGGSDVSPITLPYDEDVTPPDDPTKTGYVFEGWYLNDELYIFDKMPNMNITLTARWEISTFIVKFYNEDQSYLGEVIVNYGANAVFDEPVKESTEEYNYIFSGWSLSILNVKDNLTVYATYIEQTRYYQVVFYKDEEGSLDNEIIHLNNYAYGSSVTAPSAPTKYASSAYIYEFQKWSEEYDFIRSNLHIYPIFEKTLRSYTVKFIQDDYVTVIKEETVYYGNAATAPEAPTRESTNSYDYTFDGWDKDFDNITGNLSVYATYIGTLRIYYVSFYNDDNTLLKVDEVNYLSKATPPANPTKPSTPKFNYIFSGWDKDFDNITGDLTVTATYESVIRRYNVYFYDDDKLYLISSVSVNYGESATPPADPVKESTDEFHFTFSGWDKPISNITTTTVVYATYDSVLRSYTVRFYNEDGTVLLKEETVDYGLSATPPADPVKASTEQYKYIFAGWNLDYTFVDGNMPIYALFDEVLNKHTVKFYDEDGTLLSMQEVNYGENAIPPASPTKESTPQYNYTFGGWDKDYDNITSDLTVTATYVESPRSYVVRFYNEEEVFDVQNVNYGMSATTPNNPVKLPDEKYIYSFSNWDVDYDNITSDLNVYAEFSKTLRNYTVRFYKDETLLKTESVAYGSGATAPTNTYKTSSEMYDYTFDGWDKDFDNITGDLTIYALYKESIRVFSVKFYNDDLFIKEEIVEYGTASPTPINPTRPSTDKYHYEFIGWDKDITNITSNINVYAIYTSTLRSYTVTFYNDDVVLSTQTVNYGSSATSPANPTKPNTEKYRYEFRSWSNNYTNITGNLNIYAQYNEILRSFTVRFYNEDGRKLLQTETVTYGEDATPPAGPLKESTDKYHYEFAGWDSPYTNIKTNTNLYATYNSILRSYTVNFYNSDNEIIKTETINYGDPATAPEVPVKQGTPKYSYIFVNWDKPFDDITRNLNVYPIYSEVINSYIVKFYIDELLVKEQTVIYGEDAIAPVDTTKESTEKYNYIFTNWDKDFINVEQNLTINAIYDEVIKTFKVKFYLDDAVTVVSEQNVTYGQDATSVENPVKPSSNEYHYLFRQWDKDYTNIVEDLNIYAVFDEEVRYYTVRFYNEDVLLSETETTYGSYALEPARPEKVGDEVYYYVFSSWSENINYITKDTDIYAVFEQRNVVYIVSFYSDDEVSLLGTSNVHYGQAATSPKNVRKPSTDKYDYVFLYWDKDFDNITDDLSVYAVFGEILKMFTVNFYNESVLHDSQKVDYGSDATAPSVPTKEQTTMYHYVFSGWSIEFNNITSDLNVYATYEQKINKYTIKYYNALDEVIKEEVLEYGTLIEPIEGPDKETDHKYIYTFTKWTGYIEGMIVTKDIFFKPEYSKEDVYYTVIIIVGSDEHTFEIAYDGAFPNVDGLREPTNKYSFIPVNATIDDEVTDIPLVVKGDITIKINYESYLNVSYFQGYLNNINLDSIRSYSNLKEAYNLLEEAKEENYDYLLNLLEEKVDEYNSLVEELEGELQEVLNHQELIFKGLMGVISALNNFNYLYVFFNRRGFKYA